MTLYIVPVPIGNLKDITLRAIKTLESVDFIIAEDTKYSLKLLNHLGISKPLISYYKPREQEKIGGILKKLANQNAALITDSGTPVISDPGYILVKAAIEAGIHLESLPGPTAFVPAITLSGIDCHRFLFLGFPPKKTGELERFLKTFDAIDIPLVFYESPRRIEHFLKTALSILGPRQAALVKEISKKNEQVMRGRLDEMSGKCHSDNFQFLGEFVIVVDGRDKPLEKSIDLNTIDDIYDYFKQNHQISKNRIKEILMKRKQS